LASPLSGTNPCILLGLDHGVGHPRTFCPRVEAPHSLRTAECRATPIIAWLKVADTVIEASTHEEQALPMLTSPLLHVRPAQHQPPPATREEVSRAPRRMPVTAPAAARMPSCVPGRGLVAACGPIHATATFAGPCRGTCPNVRALYPWWLCGSGRTAPLCS